MPSGESDSLVFGRPMRKTLQIRDKVLPVLAPNGGEEEVEAIRVAIESGWWGKGPKVEEFEEKFAELVGHKYAIAVTSNSHALDLIIKALNLSDIDVINPSISFLTTAVVPLWNGCSSNIVDVEPTSLCIDPDDVNRFKKPQSELLIAVDMAGIKADYQAIRKVFNGFVVQDCAHSCWYPGAGLDGDAAVWSFQAVKTMPAGDGGMITMNDRQLADRCRELSWFGIPSTWNRLKNNNGQRRYSWDYEVNSVGYKCSMNDLTASICLVQMSKLDNNLKHRRQIQSRYNKELNENICRPAYSDTVQYYIARVPAKHRDPLMGYLADRNIHTSVHYKPLYMHEPLRQKRKYDVSEQEWLKLITLPCHNKMTAEDVDYVVAWVNRYFEEEYSSTS